MRSLFTLALCAVASIGCNQVPYDGERDRPKVELAPFEKAVFNVRTNVAKPKRMENSDAEANNLDEAFAYAP